MGEKLTHVPVIDKEAADPQEKQPKVLTESEALLIAVKRYEDRIGYCFPATRVRGVNPRLFTTKDIMEFTDDELHDYIINCKLLDAIRFMCDNIVPD